MGLRINQNIAALNAARNLRITDGAMSRSLERLSSGFRINRAADDPAGLIISENLRAQVAGLSQAIKNSNNAVNLIKTAEAALDEVLKQLRSVRTLALDALNTGASDAVARAADQTQIASSIESINRIANTTQFSKIKLLNGSSGVRGSTNNVDLTFVNASAKTVAGTFDVDVTQEATKGTKTFTIRNEFETATGGANDVIDLATSEKFTFQIDFGLDTAGTANLSAADTKALGAELKTAGLADDTTQTGVTVRFNEEDATVYVTVDRTAAGASGAANDDKVTTDLLANLNGTTLGKVIQFNKDSGAEKLQLTSRFAGLQFSSLDANIDGAAEAGFSAESAAVAAANNVGLTAANSETVKFTIDFGDGLDTTGKKALGKALADGGVTNTTAEAATNGTLDVSLNQDTAVVTVTFTEGGAVNAVIANITAAINASTSNIGRFIKFADDGSKFSISSGIRVSVTDGAGSVTSGFTAAAATDLSAKDLTAAEVENLGDGTGITKADVKVLGETLTINDATVVDIKSGTALTSVVSLINNSLTAEEIDAKATFTADTLTGTKNNNKITFDNTKFGSGATTVKSTKSSTLGFHLGIGTDVQNVAGKDVAGTINGVKADGTGQFLKLSSPGDDADGIEVKYTGTSANALLKVTVTQDSLTFQVGANTGQTVKQSIDDVRTFKLGLKATGLVTSAKSISDIDVKTVDGANDALKLVDDAIDQVTTLRGNLGAFQANVLESNIASLGVAQENLAAAESGVRDADFADETVQFTRNQILLQAGTAILTQANAIPQAVLQLLA